MFSWKVVYGRMDKITKKREKILFTYEVQCINTKKTFVRDLHASDVRYYLDCWLGVTKIQAYWSGAIVITISSIIYTAQQKFSTDK